MEPTWVCLKPASNFRGKNQEVGWDRKATYDWLVDFPTQGNLGAGKKEGELHKPNYF